MSEKCKSSSPSAIQVKKIDARQSVLMRNLDIISQLEKGEWIFYIRGNVRLADSNVRTIHDNADRNKEIAKSGTKGFVYVARLLQSMGLLRPA